MYQRVQPNILINPPQVNTLEEVIGSNIISNDNQFLLSEDHSKISFFNQSTSKKSEVLPKEQLKIIMHRKRQTLATLHSLEKQQQQARLNIRELKEKSKHLERFIHKREDIYKTRQLISRARMFEDDLTKKVKSIELRSKKELNKQKQQQINKLNVIRQHRQLEAMQKIMLIKKRKVDRENMKRKSEERERERRTKSYIFDRPQVTETPKIIKNSSPSKQLNMSSIFQSEKQYKKTTEQDKMLRKQKMKQFKKQFLRRSNKQYPETHFAAILKAEEKQEKLKERERLLLPEKYSNRMLEYGKIVRQLYQPRQRVKTEIDTSKDKSLLTKDSKSISELKQLGDSYLCYNKMHKSKRNKQTESPEPLSRIIYKDYLKDIRSTLNMDMFSMKFNRVFKESNSPEKLQKLKSILEDQQRKNPNPSEDKLKEITDAKLKIISCFI